MGKLTDDAIRMYEEDFFSLQLVADTFGVTRQAVKKYLNRRGIDTSKRQFDLVCSVCGGKFKRHRAYIRKTYRPVCSVECYHKRIHDPNYNQNRQGQRVGRALVDSLLMTLGSRLEPENVVHHENKDTEDNRIENLRVFKNNADHIRYHRGDRSKVEVIFDGSVFANKASGFLEDIKKKPRVDLKKTMVPVPKKVIKTAEDVVEELRKPRYTEKYKEKNPGERCGACGRTLRFCSC